jgi:hypothetical protein
VLIRLVQRPVSTDFWNIGYFGYWGESDGAIAGEWKVRDGYPYCGYTESPANCVNAGLYWDGNFSTGTFYNLVNGWNLNFKTGTSMSLGDSGSPVYVWKSDINWFAIIANTITSECSGTSCSGNSTPNHHRRLDPGLGNTITWARSVNP